MLVRNQRLVLLVGGTLVSAAGIVVAACSSDSGNQPLPTTTVRPDSGRSSSGTSGDPGDDDDGGENPLGDGGTGGADCSAAPQLRSNTNGFFCAFFTRDGGTDGGISTKNCAVDETCCNPAKDENGDHPASFCAVTERGTDKGHAYNTACADQADSLGTSWPPSVDHFNTGSTWECGDKNACSSGEVCCIYSNAFDLDAGDKVNVGKALAKDIPEGIPTSCNPQEVFKYGGTRCATSCGASEIQACSATDPNCALPKTCTPFQVFQGALSNRA